MRRFPIILITLAVLGAAAWSLMRWGAPSTPLSDPWRAMPANTAVVIELADLPEHWVPAHEDLTTLERLAEGAAARLVRRLDEQRGEHGAGRKPPCVPRSPKLRP